jgi:hypothetical protein
LQIEKFDLNLVATGNSILPNANVTIKPGTWIERLAKLAASNAGTRKTAHYQHGWKLDAA